MRGETPCSTLSLRDLCTTQDTWPAGPQQQGQRDRKQLGRSDMAPSPRLQPTSQNWSHDSEVIFPHSQRRKRTWDTVTTPHRLPQRASGEPRSQAPKPRLFLLQPLASRDGENWFLPQGNRTRGSRVKYDLARTQNNTGRKNGHGECFRKIS